MSDASEFLPTAGSRPVRVERSAAHYALHGLFLRLDFDFVGDRWQHALTIVRYDRHSTVLISCEGDSSNQSPPSPAFQDLRLESFSDHVHEFQLMGQSGPAVYSTAIRFDEGQAHIEFDTCARLRKPMLGFKAVSSYSTLPGWSLSSSGAGTALAWPSDLSPASSSIRVELMDIPDVGQSLFGQPQIHIGEGITIGWPVLPEKPSNSTFQTLRWRYRIALISPSR